MSITKQHEKDKEKFANDLMNLFIEAIKDKLEPEEALGILECFKAIYLDRYVELWKVK